jgi:hypothetical protein
MKTYFEVLLFSVFLSSDLMSEIKPYRPATGNKNPNHYNNPPTAEYTEDELASPPVGEIKKKELRLVNQLRVWLAEMVAGVPAGEDGQASPWFAKVTEYKSGLDTLAGSRLQADCFALIPKLEAILLAEHGIAPGFAVKCAENYVNEFSPVLIHAMARHIIDQNAVVTSTNLFEFLKVRSIPGFDCEAYWEDEPVPSDSAGLMILEPAAVVIRLKTRPLEEARQFLGNRDAADAFERYAANGNGLDVLKTKFAANPAAIVAKWDELGAWVAEQEEAEPH